MTTYSTGAPSASAIQAVSLRLHRSDKEFLERAGFSAPYPIVRIAVQRSKRARAAFANGEAFCLFGVSDAGISDTGNVWFICQDDAFEKHFRAIHKGARAWLQVFERLYAELICIVRTDNVPLVRWLEKLGFELDVPYEAHGLPMAQFRRSRVL
ncbi:hypothetical protein [Inquilinus limosus]|uniref:hypothetical protein n=1 Tax=Inquilinus limosus TaxID=171674 RepID=UPI00047E6E52|nr:hypothetical protein [Inquilinus limosus]